ncbi:hypothetical protein ABK040_002160 [Willaertia magna]
MKRQKEEFLNATTTSDAEEEEDERLEQLVTNNNSDNHEEEQENNSLITSSPQHKKKKIFNKSNHSTAVATTIITSIPDDFKSNIKFMDPKEAFLKNVSSNSFALNPSIPLPFYFLDATELNNRIFLFGKIETNNNNFVSCCVRIPKVSKNLFFVPKDIQDKALIDLDEEFENKIYEELSTILKISVDKFAFKFVKRKFTFEDDTIPYNKEVLMAKVIIYDLANFKVDLSTFKGSETFSKVLHTGISGLEQFILKRKLMGPSWLSIKNFKVISSFGAQMSWCKVELEIPDTTKENICVSIEDAERPVPPLVLMSIKLKTVLNEKKNANEIVAVCGIIQEYSFSGNSSELRKIVLARKIDDSSVESDNDKIILDFNEISLLNHFFAKLSSIDPDIFVGHNFLSFDLDILLHRWKELKGAKDDGYSKLGRLKRGIFPHLQSAPGGMGESTRAEKEILSGRLVCDTYLSAKEYLREKTYSLEDLRVSQLGETALPKDIRNPVYEGNASIISKYFSTKEGLTSICSFLEHDANVAIGLMNKLSLLPLTKELTNAAGNLWNRTLIGSRSERIEYLLLHEFHKQKYILPEKAKYSKTKGGENANPNQKKAKYTGGLVLDPKTGLHLNYILLLDFNSLYPSIILEKNICFTNFLYDDEEKSSHKKEETVLPKVIQTLLNRRKQAKRLMDSATNKVQKWQYDIRQRALKLTANSTYGCLGFIHSRFYCKQMAESITTEGRNILSATKQLIENDLKLSVIYGDTDSVMIATNLDNFDEAMQRGEEVKRRVNKQFGNGFLEIDIDGLFRRMLLLRKKKYGAVVHVKEGNEIKSILEIKGLDMVRRDWCDLSSNVCKYIVDVILRPNSNETLSPEEVVSNIHTHLREVADDVRNNRTSIDQFILTTALTKEPDQYTDASNHPHVQVALQMRKNGEAVRLHQRIPFVIAKKKDGTSSTKVAERAVHPDTFLEEQKNGTMEIDAEYYLSQQVFPPVLRLCEHIQQTDKAMLAECLGLEKKYFKTSYSGEENLEEYKVLTRQESVDDSFEDVELPCPFVCESCGKSIKFDITDTLINHVQNTTEMEVSEKSLSLLRCQHCDHKQTVEILMNQVQKNIRQLQRKYYSNQLKPSATTYRSHSDENTHVVSMQPGYGVFNGAIVSVKQVFTPQDLLLHLRYLSHIFDFQANVKVAFSKIDKERYSSLEKLKTIVPSVQADEWNELERLRLFVKKTLDKNGRQTVNLSDLFKLVSIQN